MGWFSDIREGTAKGFTTARAARLEAKGIKAVEKVEGSFMHGVGHRVGGFFGGGVIRNTFKKGLIGAAIVGGIGAVGMFAMGRRGEAKRDSQRELENAELNMEPPAVPTPPAIPAPEVGPAEGRAPGEWTQRVAAQRGMGVEAPAGPNQPAQAVMPEEMVGKLGASATTPPQQGSR